MTLLTFKLDQGQRTYIAVYKRHSNDVAVPVW